MQNRYLKQFFFVFFVLMIFASKAQTPNSRVWVTIQNENNVPYFNQRSQLISSDSLFNYYIQSIGIISCKKALPSSRKPELQKVYELTCNCTLTTLKSNLTNHVQVVSGVESAPIYDTLHIPNDFNLDPYVDNYALNLINAPAAWDITKGDSNVVIAITDQGYNPLHSELVGKYVHFNSGSNLTTHGNAVAITASGNTNNNNGISSIGYNCKLGLYAMNYNEVLNAAYAGARVINLSWSSGCFYNNYEQLCVKEAYDAGAFLVVAAGNGNTCGVPSAYVYPAAYQHTFAVTSIGSSDNHEQIPNDSTSTHQHNDRVDLSAPGYGVLVNPAESWFINGSGTSYAAPYVSGTIGLMLSVNPCLSRKDIDTILRISAVPIDSINPQYVGKLGAGRLNASAAVQLSMNWTTQPMVVTAQPVGVSVASGGLAQFSVASTSSFPVYQWQRDSSGIFVNVYNNLYYSGVNSNTLTISNVPITFNNYHYRCVMTSGYCQATSNYANLSINGTILPEDAQNIHTSTSICFGDTLLLSINPVNYATSYNWTFSGVVNIISGQNTNSISVQIFDSLTNASVTPINGNGSGNSAIITIHTIPSPTGFLSGAQTICAGDSAVLTMNATGQGPWFGQLNDSIHFSGLTNPFQIVVYPDTSTYYILQELHTIDGCYAYPDYLSSTATVSVLPYLRDTTNITVCTGQSPYLWHGFSINNAGFYNDTIMNSNGCDSILTLHVNFIVGNVPNAPASITQTLVANNCFNRLYRYAASTTANAVGYKWIIPLSCGGIGNVTVDSGDINSSRVIRLKYYSNNGAFSTDSIRVKAFNSCGFSPSRSAKLINTALLVPTTPASITATAVVTNVCGERKYRYTAPNLPSATASNTAATGYIWSFSNPFPLQAVLDSGTLNSKKIVVKYISNAAANVTDSIYLQYSSACGNTAKKSLKINVLALNPPLAPASITITPIVTSICGNRKYRLTMPILPNSTASSPAGTGYLWTLVGSAASFSSIDSGSLTSRVVVIKYIDNNATQIGDSVKAQYQSNCGISIYRSVKFSVPKLNPPSAPASISSTLVNDFCNARVYRYSAPDLPIATTTTGAATGYIWDMPIGAVGITGVLDSGTLNSKVIKIVYSNNAASTIGDSIKVLYTSGCGNSLKKTQKLTNTAISLLPAPTSITGSTNICSIVGTSNSTRYISTSVNGALSYLWTLPSGAILDSGSNGLKIRVRYITAGSNDSINVQAKGANGCAGIKKVLKLNTSGCSTLLTAKKINEGFYTKNLSDVIVYPNPSTNNFQLLVKSFSIPKRITAKILNVQGVLINTIKFNVGEIISFGNELKPGVYFVEIHDQFKLKSIRVVKY